ncbi:hypothetical protein OH491_15400 [Termitidicoccus mucosus]|uniref:hypothetical protein n=1 Tax=Termitidicoccus mucosus TaxID=1184151 RepID=UPI0031838648
MNVSGNTTGGGDAAGGFLYVASGSAWFDIAAGADAEIGSQFSAAMQADSIATNSGVNLIKTGDGLLTLWATNTVGGTATLSGGTLAIGAPGSLLAEGDFTQAANTVLSLDLANASRSTFISVSGSIFLDNSGTLQLSNYTNLIASGSTASGYTATSLVQFLMHADGTIFGDYNNYTSVVDGTGGAFNAAFSGTRDFLQFGIMKINDDTDLIIGNVLSWFTGTDTSHGNFTLNAGESFDIDVDLYNHRAREQRRLRTDASLTVTASNSGTLILSAGNSYRHHRPRRRAGRHHHQRQHGGPHQPQRRRAD